MRIPSVSEEKELSTLFVKVRGPEKVQWKDRVLIGHSLENESQKRSVTGHYSDIKVSLFQFHRQKPVLGLNLHEDLIQSLYSERPSHESLIQTSEIENWSEPASFLGNKEVSAVKA